MRYQQACVVSPAPQVTAVKAPAPHRSAVLGHRQKTLLGILDEHMNKPRVMPRCALAVDAQASPIEYLAGGGLPGLGPKPRIPDVSPCGRFATRTTVLVNTTTWGTRRFTTSTNDMPTVETGALVLVTGASGFLGG